MIKENYLTVFLLIQKQETSVTWFKGGNLVDSTQVLLPQFFGIPKSRYIFPPVYEWKKPFFQWTQGSFSQQQKDVYLSCL